jgi:hypothetical protein
MLGYVRAHRKLGQHFVGLPYYCVAPLSHPLTLIPCFEGVLADGYLLTFVSSPSLKPPSAEALLRHLPFIQGGIVNIPPSILEELHELGAVAVKAAADALAMIMYGGAPLKKEIGHSLIAAGLKIHNGYGACVSNNSHTHSILSDDLQDGIRPRR